MFARPSRSDCILPRRVGRRLEAKRGCRVATCTSMSPSPGDLALSRTGFSCAWPQLPIMMLVSAVLLFILIVVRNLDEWKPLRKSSLLIAQLVTPSEQSVALTPPLPDKDLTLRWRRRNPQACGRPRHESGSGRYGQAEECQVIAHRNQIPSQR